MVKTSRTLKSWNLKKFWSDGSITIWERLAKIDKSQILVRIWRIHLHLPTFWTKLTQANASLILLMKKTCPKELEWWLITLELLVYHVLLNHPILLRRMWKVTHCSAHTSSTLSMDLSHLQVKLIQQPLRTMILKELLKKDNSDFGSIHWVSKEWMSPIFMMMSSQVYFYARLQIVSNQDLSIGNLLETLQKINLMQLITMVNSLEGVRIKILDWNWRWLQLEETTSLMVWR